MTSDPLKTYLCTVLSTFEQGVISEEQIPKYEGPTDEQTEAILKSLATVARRLSDSEHPVPQSSHMNKVEHLQTQIEDVARVCNAIAHGDLSQKVTVPVEGGVMLQLKESINTMVDNIGHLAEQIIRVSREIGTEGNLSARTNVPNAEGTWGELIEAVNKLVYNLSIQIRSISLVTRATGIGDLSKQIEVECQGEVLQLKNMVNEMVKRFRRLDSEISRVTSQVGFHGELGQQAHVPNVDGVWLKLVKSVNEMSLSLSDQVRAITTVTTAVAHGDLTQKVEIEVGGEMSALTASVNAMVDQLSIVSSEVNRVLEEVGGEGAFGSRIVLVEELQGTWADLISNVNTMASNVTVLVRATHQVVKAITLGDLSKQLDFDARGEILELKYTINAMVQHLRQLH